MLLNFVGVPFENLVVKKRAGNGPHGHALWLCLCRCGKEAVIPGTRLKRHPRTTCGCVTKDMRGDIKGEYGRLSVLSFAGTHGRHAMYLCRCLCGKIKTIAGSSLRLGRTISCGCFRSEIRSKVIKQNRLRDKPAVPINVASAAYSAALSAAGVSFA